MAQSTNLTHLQITLNGDLEELSHLLREVEQYCAGQGLGPDPQFALTLALDELFTNAIRHGGCQGVPGSVDIHIERSDGLIYVNFRDRGTPFNPLTVPPPNLQATLEERSRGGLGVHFVRQMMRNLQYDRCGEWNQLTMELPL